jgi:hypothetical protein
VEVTGTSLLTLHGIGPSGAARLLADVGDVTRFRTKGLFALWNGLGTPAAPDHADERPLRGRHQTRGSGQRRPEMSAFYRRVCSPMVES